MWTNNPKKVKYVTVSNPYGEVHVEQDFDLELSIENSNYLNYCLAITSSLKATLSKYFPHNYDKVFNSIVYFTRSRGSICLVNKDALYNIVNVYRNNENLIKDIENIVFNINSSFQIHAEGKREFKFPRFNKELSVVERSDVYDILNLL